MVWKVFQRHYYIGTLGVALIFILYLNYSYVSFREYKWQPRTEKIYSRSGTLNVETSPEKTPTLVTTSSTSHSIWQTCSILQVARTDITTWEEYVKFNFQPTWMKTKSFWDDSFEARFQQKRSEKKQRPPLKVFLVPHSHNDPGWLKTYKGYFDSETKHILDNVVAKLLQYEDFRFIWSEICFLEMWWNQAEDWQKSAFRKLVESKRIEITTGGWVMTDEATAHVYAMLDQLIEGHHWVKANLNVTPTIGWSIDPFGHGGTVPYLLSANNFHGAVIQRVHYAWKEWFAQHEASDFIWTPGWEAVDKDQAKSNRLLTHNMPFDIYTTDCTCGPTASVCRLYDFRQKRNWITDKNLVESAKSLMEQYVRTASMFPHNVAMVLIGGDFNFKRDDELDAQYANYKKLMDHVNANKETYNAELSFGTPADYFREIQLRTSQFPTLKGDFFVYSDVFTEGFPGYWSGYYTTRPLYKLLSSQLEHNLRAGEILFTLASNYARQWANHQDIGFFDECFKKLVVARRNLGLFQHHDAITGTSRQLVMKEYGDRLFESIQYAIRIQEIAIESILHDDNVNSINHGSIESELIRENYASLLKKKIINIDRKGQSTFVVFNTLAQAVFEPITVHSAVPGIMILNDQDEEIPIQITHIQSEKFEILFVYKLPPLSLVTFKVKRTEKFKLSTALCGNCNEKQDLLKEIQLENSKMQLQFNKKSGFLKMVLKKRAAAEPVPCKIEFAGYKARPHSGAYLFKTNSTNAPADEDILGKFKSYTILVTIGPIASYVTVQYGPLLTHTVRIFNTSTYLDEALYIENDIFLTEPNVEFYMRFKTNIKNGDPAVFYSDQNGFQYQKRIKVPAVGIEGNYYPITQSAFIQDTKLRLTLLTTHAQGTASLQSGELEVMLERRITDYDWRGMGEGILDNRPIRQKFWVTLESIGNAAFEDDYQVPSLLANRLANSLRYAAIVYMTKAGENMGPTVRLLEEPLPCDVHLMNLRTISEGHLREEPSRNALLILHRQGFRCGLAGDSEVCNQPTDRNGALFKSVQVERIVETTITGLSTSGVLEDFRDLRLQPMEIKTVNVTFRL